VAERILFIDDEKNVLSAFQRLLRGDFNVTVAQGAEEAFAAISAAPPFPVVVCDMRMPGLDGIDTLKRIASESPDSVRIMLTGNADQETAVRAINEGHIFRFLTKPCPDDLLRATLKAGLRQYELVTAEKTLLEKTLAGSVRVLMDVLSVAQPEAFGRASRARAWAGQLAKALDLRNVWEIQIAALVSPIGLISVPPAVVEKSERGRPLSPAEQAILSHAPETAHRLLAHIPRLQNVAAMVLYQDRGFDGSGFPAAGPVGKEIPEGARVLRLLKDLARAGDSDSPDAAMIAEIRGRTAAYDPDILVAARRLWGSATGTDATKARVQKTVTTEGLLPGDRLVTDIVLESGKLLLGAGAQVSMAQIERLRSLKRLERIKEPLTVERVVERSAA